jgi:hypothetical protein
MSAASSVAWIQITLADLQNSRAAALVAGFTGTSLASGQSSPVPAIISDATEEILGVIGFSGRYAMDASYGTVSPNVIPPNLKSMVVENICRLLKKRLNMALLAQEVEDERNYQSRLRDLRAGEWPVDVTDNPGNNLSAQGGTVSICAPSARFKRSQLSNL